MAVSEVQPHSNPDVTIVRQALHAGATPWDFEQADAAVKRLQEQYESVKSEIEILRQTCAISFSDKDAGIATLIRRAESAEEQLETYREALVKISKLTVYVSPESQRSTAKAPFIARVALDSNPASEPKEDA